MATIDTSLFPSAKYTVDTGEDMPVTARLNALRQSQMGDIQLQQAQQALANQNALRNAMQGIDFNTPEGQEAYGKALLGVGDVKGFQEFRSGLASQTKAEHEAQTAQIAQNKAHREEVDGLIKQVAGYTDPAQAHAALNKLLSGGKIDQDIHAKYSAILDTPDWKKSILTDLSTVKDQLEASAPQTNLGKLQAQLKQQQAAGDKVGAAQTQKAIDKELGGLTEYQRQQLQLDRDRIKILQDKASSGEGTKTEGKELLTSQVISLRDAYDALATQGGIVDTKQPWYKNLSAWVGTTGVGQTVGKAIGTDTQSLRNTIAQSRPLLLNAIKQATGMSSKQLDSNAELKMYLAAATDPTLDVQANRKALRALDKMYGLGIDLGPIDENAPAAGITPAGAGAAPAASGGWGKATVVSGGK